MMSHHNSSSLRVLNQMNSEHFSTDSNPHMADSGSADNNGSALEALLSQLSRPTSMENMLNDLSPMMLDSLSPDIFKEISSVAAALSAANMLHPSQSAAGHSASEPSTPVPLLVASPISDSPMNGSFAQPDSMPGIAPSSPAPSSGGHARRGSKQRRASADRPSEASGTGGAPTTEAKRRNRLNSEQIAVLESAFTTSTSPTPDVRNALASMCKISERQVQIWFQNRRAKSKQVRRSSESMQLTPASPTTTADVAPPTPKSTKRQNSSQPSSSLPSSFAGSVPLVMPNTTMPVLPIRNELTTKKSFTGQMQRSLSPTTSSPPAALPTSPALDATMAPATPHTQVPDSNQEDLTATTAKSTEDVHTPPQFAQFVFAATPSSSNTATPTLPNGSSDSSAALLPLSARSSAAVAGSTLQTIAAATGQFGRARSLSESSGVNRIPKSIGPYSLTQSMSAAAAGPVRSISESVAVAGNIPQSPLAMMPSALSAAIAATPVSVPIPCHTLTIGTWRRISITAEDLLCMYLPSLRVLRYVIQEQGVRFILDYPATILQHLTLHVGDSPRLELATSAPPMFAMELHTAVPTAMDAAGAMSPTDYSAGTPSTIRQWTPCLDFTEQRQASQVFCHSITAPMAGLQESLRIIANMDMALGSIISVVAVSAVGAAPSATIDTMAATSQPSNFYTSSPALISLPASAHLPPTPLPLLAAQSLAGANGVTAAMSIAAPTPVPSGATVPAVKPKPVRKASRSSRTNSPAGCLVPTSSGSASDSPPPAARFQHQFRIDDPIEAVPPLPIVSPKRLATFVVEDNGSYVRPRPRRDSTSSNSAGRYGSSKRRTLVASASPDVAAVRDEAGALSPGAVSASAERESTGAQLPSSNVLSTTPMAGSLPAIPIVGRPRSLSNSSSGRSRRPSRTSNKRNQLSHAQQQLLQSQQQRLMAAPLMGNTALPNTSIPANPLNSLNHHPVVASPGGITSQQQHAMWLEAMMVQQQQQQAQLVNNFNFAMPSPVAAAGANGINGHPAMLPLSSPSPLPIYPTLSVGSPASIHSGTTMDSPLMNSMPTASPPASVATIAGISIPAATPGTYAAAAVGSLTPSEALQADFLGLQLSGTPQTASSFNAFDYAFRLDGLDTGASTGGNMGRPNHQHNTAVAAAAAATAAELDAATKAFINDVHDPQDNHNVGGGNSAANGDFMDTDLPFPLSPPPTASTHLATMDMDRTGQHTSMEAMIKNPLMMISAAQLPAVSLFRSASMPLPSAFADSASLSALTADYGNNSAAHHMLFDQAPPSSDLQLDAEDLFMSTT